MIIVGVLVVIGAMIGYTYNVMSLIWSTILLTAIQIAALLSVEKASIAALLAYFAYLTALQSGYLLGAYWQSRNDDA